MSRCLAFFLCTVFVLPLRAQDAYQRQFAVMEEYFSESRYEQVVTQARALATTARQAHLPEAEARALFFLGRALTEDRGSSAEERVEGVQYLRAASTLFRQERDAVSVDSIATLLRALGDRGENVSSPGRDGRRRPRIRDLPSEDSIGESALSAIVNLQEKEIMALTDSQLRQLILIEQKDRLLDNYAFRSLQDSMTLIRRDQELRTQQLLVRQGQQRRNFLLLLAASVAILSAALYWRYRSIRRREVELEEQNEVIRQERQRSEELLLNILPAPIAAELKEKGKATTRRYESATVMFLDFKGFSGIAREVGPEKLIAMLDKAFKAFDAIVDKHGVEKIKTIGDAYMCAAGLPIECDDHAERCVRAAVEMQGYLASNPHFDARIGIHSGPVVAGVVGSHKFAYDIWGDTVNQASRLESACQPGGITISEATKALLSDEYLVEEAGTFLAKNIGETKRYSVTV